MSEYTIEYYFDEYGEPFEYCPDDVDYETIRLMVQDFNKENKTKLHDSSVAKLLITELKDWVEDGEVWYDEDYKDEIRSIVNEWNNTMVDNKHYYAIDVDDLYDFIMDNEDGIDYDSYASDLHDMFYDDAEEAYDDSNMSDEERYGVSRIW